MNFESASYFQFSHISEWRKYWLIANNSSCRASFNTAITFSLPFIAYIPPGFIRRAEQIAYTTRFIDVQGCFRCPTSRPAFWADVGFLTLASTWSLTLT